jgi:hypothetical protein
MAARFTNTGDGRIDFGSGANLDNMTEFTIMTVMRFHDATPQSGCRIWSKGQSEMELRTAGANTVPLFQVFRDTTNCTFQADSGDSLAIDTWWCIACTYSETDSGLINMVWADFEDDLDNLAAPTWATNNTGSGGITDNASEEFWVGNRPNGGLNRAGDLSVAGIIIVNEALELSEQETLRDTWTHTNQQLNCIIDAHTTADDTSSNNYDGTTLGTVSTFSPNPTFPVTGPSITYYPGFRGAMRGLERGVKR